MANDILVDTIMESRIRLNKIPDATNLRLQSYGYLSRETNIETAKYNFIRGMFQ